MISVFTISFFGGKLIGLNEGSQRLMVTNWRGLKK
jgi:hypothetical protein